MFWTCCKSLKFNCHILDKTTIHMAMHSRDPPNPRRPKTKLALNRINLVKLCLVSVLKNCQEDRSQIDKCAGKSWVLANHKAGIYPICIKQTNIKLKIQLLTSIAKHNTNFTSFMFCLRRKVLLLA